MKSSQSGQIVIILLLITLVALSVGLAITQRSLTSITTSTQNEQASRAFSAADAGIERAIQQDATITSFAVGTDSSASVTKTVLPFVANQALEYPPVGKETIAQFWLADPDNLPSWPTDTTNFHNPTVDIYFGDSNASVAESPAIEINAITADTSTNPYTYASTRTYIDSVNNATINGRYPNNGFNDQATCPTAGINTSSSPNGTDTRPFKCRYTLTISTAANIKAVMLRTRILYSNLNHPVAVKPQAGRSLPPQASIFVSRGISGQSQKTLQVFRLKYVVPQFFDFSIFSGGDITKPNN